MVIEKPENFLFININEERFIKYAKKSLIIEVGKKNFKFSIAISTLT